MNPAVPAQAAPRAKVLPDPGAEFRIPPLTGGQAAAAAVLQQFGGVLGDAIHRFGHGAVAFLVQWLASERARKSVVPTAFWYFSLGGGLILDLSRLTPSPTASPAP